MDFELSNLSSTTAPTIAPCSPQQGASPRSPRDSSSAAQMNSAACQKSVLSSPISYGRTADECSCDLILPTNLIPWFSTAWNSEALHTPTKPYVLLDFEDDSAVAGCKTMADRAVGGFSTASLDYVPADPATQSPAHARFHGSISTKLPNNWRVERTGTMTFSLPPRAGIQPCV